MLKKSLTVAITAALGLTAASSAMAVSGLKVTLNNGSNETSVSRDNVTGERAQVLHFPYYGVSRVGDAPIVETDPPSLPPTGNPGIGTAPKLQTTFIVRNTKNEFKALRFRFHEGKNSKDVYDFNVYMSPYDEFTVTLDKLPQSTDPDLSGNTVISTSDQTCTFPDLLNAPLKDRIFKTFALGDGTSAEKNNVLTNEGYLNVIEMGSWSAASTGDLILDPLRAALKHVSGVPAGRTAGGGCDILATYWGNGTFTQGGAIKSVALISGKYDTTVGPTNNRSGTPALASPKNDFIVTGWYGGPTPANIDPPTGGIAGVGLSTDLALGAAYVSDATEIAGYSTRAQHYNPGDLVGQSLPDLASGNTRVSSVPVTDFNGFANTLITYWPFVNVPGEMGAGINPFPIAHVLQSVAVDNEYFFDPATVSPTASTEWIFSFPMRVHGIHNNRAWGLLLNDFANIRQWHNKTGVNGDPRTDVLATVRVWDREEAEDVPDFSPREANQVKLDRETNVIEFLTKVTANDVNKPAQSGVLGSTNAGYVGLSNGFGTAGWAKFMFNGYDLNLQDFRYAYWVDFRAGIYTPGATPPIVPVPLEPWIFNYVDIFDAQNQGNNGLAFKGVATTSLSAIRGFTGTFTIGEILPGHYTYNRGMFLPFAVFK